MKLKEATYEEVQVLKRQRVTEEVYGCDECHKELTNEDGRKLSLTVFSKAYYSEGSDHLDFCSWDCVLKHLTKVKCDDFISLPYVSFDRRKGSKTSANHLISLIKKMGL